VELEPGGLHLAYTWEVIPDDLKLDLVDSICSEFAWVLGELRTARPAGAM
jgi:hypothetical protein